MTEGLVFNMSDECIVDGVDNDDNDAGDDAND